MKIFGPYSTQTDAETNKDNSTFFLATISNPVTADTGEQIVVSQSIVFSVNSLTYTAASPIAVSAGSWYWVEIPDLDYTSEFVMEGSATDQIPGQAWQFYSSTCANFGGWGTRLGCYGGIPYDWSFLVLGEPVSVPMPTNLNQYKSDATTPVPLGGTTTEDTVNFQATVSSPSGLQVSLEVETQLAGVPFTNTPTATSTLVTSGSAASTTIRGLSDGSYIWQARTRDSQGATSNWQRFSNSVDFSVHQVPLYTQIESNFPSLNATQEWAGKQYGKGNYNCLDSRGISTIGSCGCAITSLVMVSRYHGALIDVNGNNIDPTNINDWLSSVTTSTSTIGYTEAGTVWWSSIIQYTNGQVVFSNSVNSSNLAILNSLLDSELANLNPAILYEPNVRNGHFIVADSKLASTYHIRDPYFFNNKYLTNDTNSTNTHNYGNYFGGIRTFSLGNFGTIPPSIMMNLASPAEIVVTDPTGKRVGFDPATNTSYNEITGGAYFKDSIGGGPDDATSTGHEVKVIWIPTPVSGTYNVSVTGTDSGQFTFGSLVYGNQNDPHLQFFVGSTQANLTTLYSLNYSPDHPDSIIIKPQIVFSGFLTPIKADGSGIYKQGRTLPVKFQLTDQQGMILTNRTAQLFVAKIQDGIVGIDEIPLSTSTANIGNNFRFDTISNQYIFNLDTSSLSPGTWQLKVLLDDGTTHTVVVSIKQ